MSKTLPPDPFGKGQRAIQLLREMEWAGFHTDNEENWAVMTIACPCCMNSKRDGHKPGCKLKECITNE
jgi:hypothetical protein